MNQHLWAVWFPNVPMPEGCTYEQFVAARDELWAEEDLWADLEKVKEYEELMTIYPEELVLIKTLLQAKSAALGRIANARL